MSDRQNKNDRPFDFFALCAAIVAEAAKSLPHKLAAGLRATYESFPPKNGTEPGRISPRGVRSGIVAFHLRLGTKPAELAKQRDILYDGPFDASVARSVLEDAVARSYAPMEGRPIREETEENRRSRLAAACSYFLTELYAVAATEWHNAAADASIRSGDERVCHVVAQSFRPEDALMQQLGMSVAPAAQYLATPCGLASVVDGLARVPKERRLAASAEIIRYLNTIGGATHADVDRLIDVAVDIYG